MPLRPKRTGAVKKLNTVGMNGIASKPDEHSAVVGQARTPAGDHLGGDARVVAGGFRRDRLL